MREYKYSIYAVMVIGVFFILSCNFKTTRNNSKEDHGRAVRFCSRFYQNKLNGNFTSAAKFADNIYLSESKLLQMIQGIDSTLGKLVSYDLIKVGSKVTLVNGNETGDFEVYYKCSYEKDVCDESFVLSSSDTIIKIEGYRVIPSKHP